MENIYRTYFSPKLSLDPKGTTTLRTFNTIEFFIKNLTIGCGIKKTVLLI